MFSQSINNRGVGSSTHSSSTPLTNEYTSGTGSADSDFPLKAYVTIVQYNLSNIIFSCNVILNKKK